MKGQSKFSKLILLLGDVCSMYCAIFLALFFRNSGLVGQVTEFFYNFTILYIIWISIIFILGFYDLHIFKRKFDFFFSLAVFALLAFFIGVTYFYFRPTFGITPKTVLLFDVILFTVLFGIWRYLFNAILEVRGIKEKIVIVGFYKRLEEILPQLQKIYSIEAIFCPPGINEQNKCLFVSDGVSIISEISALKGIVLEKKVTSIIFSLDFYLNEGLIKDIFNVLPLTLNYIGIDEVYESITKKVSLDHLDEVWFLEKISKPADIFEQSVKRIFDIALSLIGLIIFLVLWPFIALAIKVDDNGSIFYTQKRVGKNGKNILIRKFRTMKECDSKNKEILREANNCNVTKIGKIIRRLHLDELPQAWNVFRGDLSFVGPRTEWVELAKTFEKEIPFYKERYLVKPGIFGWAQINFPASLSVDKEKKKLEYDLYYVKNHSLLLDLEIILKSIKLFFL